MHVFHCIFNCNYTVLSMQHYQNSNNMPVVQTVNYIFIMCLNYSKYVMILNFVNCKNPLGRNSLA